MAERRPVDHAVAHEGLRCRDGATRRVDADGDCAAGAVVGENCVAAIVGHGESDVRPVWLTARAVVLLPCPVDGDLELVVAAGQGDGERPHTVAIGIAALHGGVGRFPIGAAQDRCIVAGEGDGTRRRAWLRLRRQVGGQIVGIDRLEIDLRHAGDNPGFPARRQLEKLVGAGVFGVAVVDDEAQLVTIGAQRHFPKDAEIVAARWRQRLRPQRFLRGRAPYVQPPTIVGAVGTVVMDRGGLLRQRERGGG